MIGMIGVSSAGSTGRWGQARREERWQLLMWCHVVCASYTLGEQVTDGKEEGSMFVLKKVTIRALEDGVADAVYAS